MACSGVGNSFPWSLVQPQHDMTFAAANRRKTHLLVNYHLEWSNGWVYKLRVISDCLQGPGMYRAMAHERGRCSNMNSTETAPAQIDHSGESIGDPP